MGVFVGGGDTMTKLYEYSQTEEFFRKRLRNKIWPCAWVPVDISGTAFQPHRLSPNLFGRRDECVENKSIFALLIMVICWFVSRLYHYLWKFLMEAKVGYDPTTYSLQRNCTSQLCYLALIHVIYLMAGSDGNAPSPSDSKSEMLTFTPQPNTPFII